MEQPLHLAAGIAILALVSIDFLLATLGAAPRVILSECLARGIFSLLRQITRHRPARVLARISGVIAMVLVAGFWVVGTAPGWTHFFRHQATPWC